MRILFISPYIQKKFQTASGHAEFIDVHYCIDDKLSAIKLFVDTNCAVRTQVRLSTRKDEEVTIEETEGFTIPVPKPKKPEISKQPIIPNKDFTAFYVKSLEIVDKLREQVFTIIERDAEKCMEVEALSTLHFIQIKAKVKESLNRRRVKKWLHNVADLIERLVMLDEDGLSLIPVYLDHVIDHDPSDTEVLELDLILQSNIAIPHSTEEHIHILNKNFDEIFPFESVKIYRIFVKMMELCLNNENRTLMQIYELYKSEATDLPLVSYPYFISLVAKLVNFGFVNIEKLEFYTITRE
ncbi:MAG: hypothetical protein ACTSQE_12790 [Candidatus Heimdallarchaeaceae archaeon]